MDVKTLRETTALSVRPSNNNFPLKTKYVTPVSADIMFNQVNEN